MIINSKAEKKYWDALKRIQDKNTEIVNVHDVGFRISNLTVALEAGKNNPKGYIRPQRYPELCDAIKAADNDRQSSLSTSITRHVKSDEEMKKSISAKYRSLRGNYELLLEKYLNVVKENFELKARGHDHLSKKV